ncbi:zinc finger protein 287-like [Contarinia nasturtii]|uniref:zinc finger protein 287-like n=1 Tax=Contarinia nasturtii TaxID=265458 RepID=UPI0012D46743|nr:zinc finger protein 287-like [Contarinia nasturtii]
MNPYQTKDALGGRAEHKYQRKGRHSQVKIKEEVDVKVEPGDGVDLIAYPPLSPLSPVEAGATIKSESESDSEYVPYDADYVKYEIKSEEEECLKKKHDEAPKESTNEGVNYNPIRDDLCDERPNSSNNREQHAKGKKPKCGKSKGSKKPSNGRATIGQKKHKCHFCDYVTNHKPNLTRHIRTHTGEKSFECEVCAKAFAQKNDLNRHKKIHGPKLPFRCLKCGHRYEEEVEKQSHEDGCNYRRYECYLCEYKSFNSGHLKYHMRLKHTDDKPFQCANCGKKFIHKGNLNRHKCKPRPYRCTKCHRPFAIEDDKDQHQVQCKRRCYQCYLCKNIMQYTTHLTLHMRNHHTGEKPFPCKLCNARFPLLGDANKHMKNIHGMKK